MQEVGFEANSLGSVVLWCKGSAVFIGAKGSGHNIMYTSGAQYYVYFCGSMSTWTPKVCKIVTFMAIIGGGGGLGLLFYMLLGFRYEYYLHWLLNPIRRDLLGQFGSLGLVYKVWGLGF